MFDRSGRLQRIRDETKLLAELRGEWEATKEIIVLAKEYEATKKALTEAQIELDRAKEDHSRENREIEHKLGLHKIQVEQERASAVTEAKLAVREEALSAQEGRFKQEMEFMQNRFEQEVQSQRKLVEQVLDRLPHFEHRRVEHIGVDPNPAQRLEITEHGGD